MKKTLLSASVIAALVSSCSMIEDVIDSIDTTTPDGGDTTVIIDSIGTDTAIVDTSAIPFGETILSLNSARGLWDLTGNTKIQNYGVTTGNGFNINSNSYAICYSPRLDSIGSANFTIAFSLKAGKQDGVILSKYRGGVGAPEKGWNIQLEDGTGSGGGVDVYKSGIRFDISDGYNGGWGILASGCEFLDNQWHDVTIEFNKSKEYARMIIDGATIDSANISKISDASNSKELYIGYRGDNWVHLNGSLENIEIINGIR